MNRQEFLERLRILLGDLSEEEREEAVQYYEDYFADAGPEMEEQIIKELGSPEKVDPGRIKRGRCRGCVR